MAPQTTAFVCFNCRKHRSLLRYGPYSKDKVPCPECQEPMNHIGWRLQIPRKDDHDAWDRFWLQYISPGYGPKGLVTIDAENLHFETCKAKKRSPPREEESTGCARCDVVWTRMLEAERERWRKGRTTSWPGSI
jgi:hypothetical protein